MTKACCSFLLAVALAASVFSSAGYAAEYPVKPIRMVVPYPPGGPADIMARSVTVRLPDLLGQPFIVDNRAGASGMIGSEAVARAAPDGYTLLVNTSIHIITPSLFAKMPFDALQDFTHISLLSRVPLFLVVHPTLPVRNIRQLIALAKAHPGKLNFASSSIGAGTHLAGELFKNAAQIDIKHIPYKGSAPALTDLMGGHVEMMFDTTLTTLPYMRSGRLRALAVSTAQRSQAAPEIPTVAESGVAGYDASNWYALWGPAKMPRDLTARISGEVSKALKDPAVRGKLVDLGADPVGSTPDEFEAFARAEFAKWAKVVKAAGIKPE